MRSLRVALGPLVAGIVALVALAPAAVRPASSPPIRALAREAGDFWGGAPLRAAVETLRQSTTVRKQRRGIHFSNKKPDSAVAIPLTREIVSWYGFGALRSAPESIHEFRQIISIDGKPARSAAGWDEFRRILLTRDDEEKRRLLEDFDSAALGDAPADFGQILLLFTNRHIDDYIFTDHGTGRVGVDEVNIFQYVQNAGKQALHLSDGGRPREVPLYGLVYLRSSDNVPVRVTMASQRGGKTTVRDEAEVDYSSPGPGVLEPASLVHRRFVDGQLEVEDRAEYADWRLVRPAN